MSDEKPLSQTPENPSALPNLDPSGPPQPVEKKDPILQMLTGVAIGVVVLGGLLLPATCCVNQTCGATRSAKLRWEHRQQEIRQAQAASESRSHE
jgi:hypothetical protein